MIYAVSRVLQNALEQHPPLPYGVLGGPSLCSLRNGLLVQHGPQRQDASITAMLFYIMDENVFLPVFGADQDITAAGARVISGGESLPAYTTDFVDSSCLPFEKLPCIAPLATFTLHSSLSWHECFAADPLALRFLVTAL